jgi:hypothetical protein
MAGRKALYPCWPILVDLNFVLTLLSLEFVVFEMVRTQSFMANFLNYLCSDN